MVNIYQWAQKHGISVAAMFELECITGINPQMLAPDNGGSESRVQSLVRLEASAKGMRLFRNNVGVVVDETSIGLRFGLANDSKALNKQFKSGDLIGIRPHVATAEDVGRKFGIFLSRECKREGWHFNPNDEHELAQWRWITFVNMMGGDAAFATGEGTL